MKRIIRGGILFFFFVSVIELYAQAIEPRDCAEIRMQAAQTLQGFALLLNQIADPTFYPSERNELIQNSFKQNNPGRVFYSASVIVENDLNPVGNVAQNTGLNDKKIGQYLQDVDLLYSKNEAESVFFSNLHFGPVREKEYAFLQILYNSAFTGRLKDEPGHTLPRHRRVATIRAEKIDGQWRTYLLQINFHSPDFASLLDYQDTDCDGITDPEDDCPEEAGAPAWNGCPPPPNPDADQDGLADNTDACPEQMGPWCAQGCPLAEGRKTGDGRVLWQELLGNTGLDVAFDIAKSEKGEVVFAGETEVPGAGKDLYVAIFDPCRKYISNRLVVGGAQDDGARKVIPTGPGQYALAGYSESSGSGSRDAWLLLTDGTRKIGEKFFGTAAALEAFTDLARDARDDLLFAGENDGKIWLLKTTREGAILKEVLYEGKGPATGTALALSPQGDIFLTGYESVGNRQNLLVLHYDEANERLEKIYEKAGAKGLDILVDREGQLVVAGTVYTKRSRDDIFILRLDTVGRALWDEPGTFGGIGVDVGCSLLEAEDGNYVLAGYSSSYAEGARREQVWVNRMSPSGDALWDAPLFLGDQFSERAYGMTQIESNRIIVAGFSRSSTLVKKTHKSGFLLVSIQLK